MPQQDVRWQQRFHNYGKALSQLQEAVELQQTSHTYDEKIADAVLRAGKIFYEKH